MAYLNKINIFDRNTLKRALCLHGQILSPIKQNEEFFLWLFPHFALFSILYSPDFTHKITTFPPTFQIIPQLFILNHDFFILNQPSLHKKGGHPPFTWLSIRRRLIVGHFRTIYDLISLQSFNHISRIMLLIKSVFSENVFIFPHSSYARSFLPYTLGGL